MVSVTISLKQDVYDKLREFCKKYNTTESKVVSYLIVKFIEELERRKVMIQHD